VIYFLESETRVIEPASAFNAEREGSPISSSASETASEVLSSATPLCAPKELKLEEPSHTGLSVRAVVENRYMGGETRDEGWRVATSAYRTIQISVGLRTQKSLFTCHGINKKILSCFFEKRSIVLQSAVGTSALLDGSAIDQFSQPLTPAWGAPHRIFGLGHNRSLWTVPE
jgi:hypothetical protein